MFYILDFTDHTFAGYHLPEEVNQHVEKSLSRGVDIDCIEVICADDESRMSVENYKKNWGKV